MELPACLVVMLCCNETQCRHAASPRAAASGYGVLLYGEHACRMGVVTPAETFAVDGREEVGTFLST